MDQIRRIQILLAYLNDQTEENWEVQQRYSGNWSEIVVGTKEVDEIEPEGLKTVDTLDHTEARLVTAVGKLVWEAVLEREVFGEVTPVEFVTAMTSKFAEDFQALLQQIGYYK